LSDPEAEQQKPFLDCPVTVVDPTGFPVKSTERKGTFD
jgi:hypothetical protein